MPHLDGTGLARVWSAAVAKFAAKSHSHGAATQSAAGMMSAADKKKLDGVAAGANAYTHPTTAGNKHIPSGGAAGQTLVYSASGTAQWASRLLYLYSATLKVDGWTESGGAFTQTVTCSPADSGPALTANTRLSGPMCVPTGVEATDKSLQAALGILNAGVTTPAAAKITCKVWKKPACDCTVFWYGKG